MLAFKELNFGSRNLVLKPIANPHPSSLRRHINSDFICENRGGRSVDYSLECLRRFFLEKPKTIFESYFSLISFIGIHSLSMLIDAVKENEIAFLVTGWPTHTTQVIAKAVLKNVILIFEAFLWTSNLPWNCHNFWGFFVQPYFTLKNKIQENRDRSQGRSVSSVKKSNLSVWVVKIRYS